MIATAEPRICPFCGAVQPPTPARIARCRRCNLFFPEPKNPADGGLRLLESVSRDFCPWCAYPVAREHSLPAGSAFVCPGCSGTLTIDVLETQAAIDGYRKRGLRGGGFLIFIAVLVATIAIIILLIRR